MGVLQTVNLGVDEVDEDKLFYGVTNVAFYLTGASNNKGSSL